MKVLLDTSILTAALVKVHPAHPVAVRWLQRIRNGDVIEVINVHALAELYSNLTRIPFVIAISEALRKQLGLTPGMSLVVEAANSGIRLRVKERPSHLDV